MHEHFCCLILILILTTATFTSPCCAHKLSPWAAGMYFYERAWHSLRGLSGKAVAAARKSTQVQNNEAQQKQPTSVLERVSDHTNAEAPPTSR